MLCYHNQRDVDLVSAELTLISPDLAISNVSSKDGYAISACVEIAEKNNKDVIDKLIAVGFKHECRYFKTTENGFTSFLTLKKNFSVRSTPIYSV